MESLTNRLKAAGQTVSIHPPRGVSSLTDLSVKKGEIFIIGTQMDSMVLELLAFDFSFLPGLTMKNPEIIVTFDHNVKTEV